MELALGWHFLPDAGAAAFRSSVNRKNHGAAPYKILRLPQMAFMPIFTGSDAIAASCARISEIVIFSQFLKNLEMEHKLLIFETG